MSFVRSVLFSTPLIFLATIVMGTISIIGPTRIPGLWINCGWGTGGFKATPGSGRVFADTLAHERPHPLVEPFALERFTTGGLIDEHGAAGVAH